MGAWTKEEMDALKRRVINDFKQTPFDNKNVTVKFIDYLNILRVEGEKISSFFEEYDEAHYNCTRKSVYERLKEYYSYHRIFFWQAGLDAYRFYRYEMEKEKEIINNTCLFVISQNIF